MLYRLSGVFASLLVALSITGCAVFQGNEVPTMVSATVVSTADPNAIRTEVALTVEADATLFSAQTQASEPSATVVIISPTQASIATTQAPVTISTVTQILPTATSTITTMPTATQTATRQIFLPTFTPTYYPDQAELVSVIPAPGITLGPGNDFDLIFRLKNTGDRNWTTRYQIELVDGLAPSTHTGETYSSVDLSGAVPAGQTVDIVLDMIAPQVAGNYHSRWALVNLGGTTFFTINFTFRVSNP
jgi:hypothetical protein